MLRWFYVLAHFPVEAGAARRDARIRFLKAQVETHPRPHTASDPTRAGCRAAADYLDAFSRNSGAWASANNTTSSPVMVLMS